MTDSRGGCERFDHLVMALPADQTLAVLSDATSAERVLLGAVRYSRNRAVLHCDDRLMPKRRSVWSSWNYIDHGGASHNGVCVTYWMNRLQRLATDQPLFVTLNPPRPPRQGLLLHSEIYHHPIIDSSAAAAQRRLWSLQGRQRTWFCGAYFGAGFHEDGLQSGLAVAEQLGGLRRPWTVPNETGRIALTAVQYTAGLEVRG
jgi:predicted NAD/FAD-binding protein